VNLSYPNFSGTLATGGGLVFLALLDGTVAAFDDTTLDELWKINLGSGFSAPPMTFEVNGKQYIAIVSGPSPAARSRLVNTPELREQRNAVVLYVFALCVSPTSSQIRRSTTEVCRGAEDHSSPRHTFLLLPRCKVACYRARDPWRAISNLGIFLIAIPAPWDVPAAMAYETRKSHSRALQRILKLLPSFHARARIYTRYPRDQADRSRASFAWNSRVPWEHCCSNYIYEIYIYEEESS
jgi:hypothetical protein